MPCDLGYSLFGPCGHSPRAERLRLFEGALLSESFWQLLARLFTLQPGRLLGISTGNHSLTGYVDNVLHISKIRVVLRAATLITEGHYGRLIASMRRVNLVQFGWILAVAWLIVVEESV